MMSKRDQILAAMRSAYVAGAPFAVIGSQKGIEAALDAALDAIIDDIDHEGYQRTAGYMIHNYREKR